MTSSIRSRSREEYEEFYSEWYPRAVAAARGRGLRDPEAVASDIMVMFFEKDYLDRFDPTRESGSATFKSWVNSMIYKRLANAYRDESRRPFGVELMDHDRAVADEPIAEFKMLAMSCFQLLRDRYGEELATVWVSVVKQVSEDTTASSGKARQWLIAKHLQCGSAAASSLMNRLRHVLTHDADLREMLGLGRSFVAA